LRVSNYTGQVLLGMGVAMLAALFYAIRGLLHHWRVWHLSAVMGFLIVLVLVWRSLRQRRVTRGSP
jgi:Flp pilus assembly protein TadB